MIRACAVAWATIWARRQTGRLDFFENGNPTPGRARPKALTFGTIPGLIFTFPEKEFLFYDFFWVWGFSLLEGARVYFYGLVLGLWLCVPGFASFYAFNYCYPQQNNVVLSFSFFSEGAFYFSSGH